MTTLRDAALLRQALEALESDPVPLNAINNACAVLRAALAEPVQEPVALMEPAADNDSAYAYADGWNDCVNAHKQASPPQRPAEPVQEPVAWKDKFYESLHHQDFGNSIPLYAAPPQRLPLTEEEISSLWDNHIVPVFGKNGINPIVFARAIEQAHGIGSKT